ncbi:MAG: restriction endonuclease subunit S [Zetaproteobacteria bacterium]|nr:restriction endonuclease subunit S [Zetaproteobacteria bacterium]
MSEGLMENGELKVENGGSAWREVRLGDLLKLITKGTTPPKGKGFVDEGVNYIKSDAISYDGKIDINKFVAIDQNTHNKFKRSQLEELDILFSMAGAYLGKNGIVFKSMLPANTNQALAILRVNQNLALPYYISKFLSQPSMVDYINNMSGQSAQPNINFQEISSIEINLPPLPEQKAIAEVLSALDDKIDLLHRQNKTLEQMAETLFRQWFVVEADEDWEYEEILKYVSVVDNRGKTPPNTSSITPFPLIEVNALGKVNRLVDYSVIRKYVDEDTYKNWFRNKPKKYDTLLSTVGSIGAISMYLLEEGNVAQNVIALSAKNISPLYLFQALKYKTGEILQLDIGGVQPSIKVPHLLSLIIPIPSPVIQKNFEKQVIEFVSKMEKNYKQIRTLQSLRDTLLPKLMSGEVRIASNG